MAYTDEKLLLLMDRAGPPLWRLALALAPTEETAEDLFQTAFLRLAREDTEEDPAAGLLRAAFRRAKEQSAKGRYSGKGLRRRAAIHLCCGEEMAEAEVAPLLGVRPFTLRRWLKSAPKKEEAAENQAGPAPGLIQETMDLIAEARAHHSAPPQNHRSGKKAVIAASCVCGVLVLLIAASAVFLARPRGEVYEDTPGDYFIQTPAPDPDPDPDPAPEDPTPAPDPDPAPEVKDPFAPEFIETEEQHTYASIAAFIAALEDKSAPGYGKGYYNARGLIIVPGKLPDRAVFRCLYLYSETGQYEYSYRVPYGGEQYLITLRSEITPPKTALAVEDHQAAAREEEVSFTEEGNQRTYRFGEQDRMIVTVTRLVAEKEKPEEETEAEEKEETEEVSAIPNDKVVTALLSQFSLERCTLTNQLIQM